MKMKKLSALILCFTMLLSMSFSAEVYAHEEDIMRTENYQKTKAFVDSGDIYDLGLYSMEDAVRIIGRQDPDFADLCGEPQTVASLAVLISQEDDEFLKNLMVFWYNYLLIQHGFPVTYSNTSDYVSYTLTLPGGKTIDALLYLSDCPYYTDAEHGTTHYLTNVKYYRLSHQYILSGNYYYCKCCGYKNPTMVVSGVTK